MADEAASGAPAEPGFRHAAGHFAARLVGTLQTRVALAGVELSEQREQATRSLIALSIGGVCLAFALLVATFGVIAWYWDTNRYAAIVAVAFLYAVAGGLALMRFARLRRGARAPFEATLAELDRDRRRLTGEDAEGQP